MKNRILFIKGILPGRTITELNAEAILNDEKYDNNPYINKQSIINAFQEYSNLLNPLNKEIIPNLVDINVNIEGNFIAYNIPELDSIVYDEICTKKELYDILDKHQDLTHIALSSYAVGLDNSIEIINIIKSEYSHIELLVGGVGAVYSQIQKLIHPKNLCIGEGVNFFRKKFGLTLLKSKDFKIPQIEGNATNIPVPFKVKYMITQLGCPLNCDFCITHNFIPYSPLSDPNKIISFFKQMSCESNKDLIVYLCDPNAFYPENRWNKIFNYFIANPHELDNDIFILGLSSLRHINNFNIEQIQEKSPLKFFCLNYGIESTLNKGYAKNKGDAIKIINRLNNNNIITYHTSILGLPLHTKKNIILDIENQCDYASDVISFNTFKTIPTSLLYEQIKRENRLLFDNIPPEFYYMEGYLPFIHPHLGYGFDILSYAFKAYYESEKKLLSLHLNLADKLIDLFALSNNRKVQTTIKILILLSKKNYQFFKLRMPLNLSHNYQTRLNEIIKKVSNSPKKPNISFN